MLSSVYPITLSGCGNDYASFVDTCYQCYHETWSKKPLFKGKIIVREKQLDKDNKEKSFWGIVEGHNDKKIFQNLKRYETITYFKEIMLNLNQATNKYNDDILWFVFDRKINIIAKELNYLIILKENKQTAHFITAYPVNETKKHKLVEFWKEYWTS